MKQFTKECEIYTGQKVSMNISSYPVDPAKFKKLISLRGIIAADVSSTLGYARNTISGALNAGIFSGPIIAGLKNTFGIQYEEYAYIPEEKPPEPPKEPEEKPESVCADQTALYQTMRLAVHDALEDILSANTKTFRGIIFSAIVNALKRANGGAEE